MRELKFRAWHKECKTMTSNQEFEGEVFLWKHSGEDIDIMQFTGLKDRDGVEIYEGDIVLFDIIRGDGKMERERFFQRGQVRIDPYGTTFGSWCADFCRSAKVIGNIYENPEFLQ